jgi:hypothetical protein
MRNRALTKSLSDILGSRDYRGLRTAGTVDIRDGQRIPYAKLYGRAEEYPMQKATANHRSILTI